MQLINQVLRFLLIGGFTTIIDYGVLISLTELANLNYLLSSFISFLVSCFLNYLLTIRIVFIQETKCGSKKVLAFVVLGLIGLLINEGLMWVGVEKFLLNYVVAKVGSTIIVTCYNFISRKLLLEK